MLGRALNMPLRVLHDIQVLHLVGKNMSLLERIQNRLQSNSNNLNILKETPRISTCDNVSETESESESDINDDITIEECAAIMTQRKKEKEHAFTRVKSKPPVQLRDFLSEKMTFLENQTANNLLSNDHEQYCGDKSEENEINDVLMSDVNSENNANEQINDALCKNIPLVSSDSCSNDSGIQLNKNLSSISIPESCKIHLNNKFSGTNSISIESNTNENDNSSKISIDTEGINLSVPVKRKRAKLTPEEKQAAKEQKEKEKQERQREREKSKLEKELEKEREKARKRAATLSNRSERKDECMERLLCVIDPAMIEEGGADILKALQDINVRYELKKLPVGGCIGWMRENVDYSVDEKSQVIKTSSYKEEAHIIYKMAANELATRIHAQINNVENTETFNDLIDRLRHTYPNKKYTFVVLGMNTYYRYVKMKGDQKFRNNVLGNEASGNAPPKKKKGNLKKEVPILNKKDIEEILAEVQVTTNISIRYSEDNSHFSLFVQSFTKSIGEAPFKKTYDSSLHFTCNGSSDKSSVKLGNDGYGTLQLWNQQLQQFYGVRHDTANAIAQVYPTPLSLIKAYEGLTEIQGKKLLQDIEVRRGLGVLQTQRRVGPELSKKLYKLMTSTNGEEPLAR